VEGRGPKLERYEILEELGQGGMSVVYRARDRQLPRDVAVKVLHEFLARQPEARQRFHREAVAVAKLHHPCIVEIFDYSGPERADAFIVTELIRGVTLRQFHDAHGPLRFPELGALITAEICRALQHAHEAGVIHRDLKPENVMVTQSGELKLMDFGIAQIQEVPKLTMTGTLLGSPAHMAPEVIDGERPDQRADLFSLGTILYWLATGKLPFDAPNPSALFRQILEGRYEDPQQVQPKIGNGLARIIRRLLEPDRAARFQDAAELARELQRELDLVDLCPAETRVRELLADPAAFSARLEEPLISRLVASGRAALAEKNLGRAMDRFNRVLAIRPDHAEVRALVRGVGRSQELRRRVKQAAWAVLAAAVVGGAAFAGQSYLGPVPVVEPPPAPLTAAPPDLPLIAAAPPAAEPAFSREPERPDVEPADEPEEPRRPPPVKARPGPAIVPPAQTASAAAAAGPPDAAVAAPRRAELRFRIGRSWANVFVDGRQVLENAYSGVVALDPGRHQLRVERPPLGAFRPRTLEVDEAGAIREIRPGEPPQLVHQEMLFVVPRPGEPAPEDWEPR
jgi:serine/threonine-protein kinase